MTYFINPRTNRPFSSLIAIVFLSMAGKTAASDPGSYLMPNGPAPHPVPPYPVEMGFSQHHSSTLFESWQRGRAALIQAFGNYQLSRTQAQIVWEQARALNRENRLKWHELREQAKREQAAKRAAGEQKLSQRRATVYRNLYQLSADQFDPTTGEIDWPTVLQSASYQPLRERVDELFRTYVGYGEPQPATARQIARCIEPLKYALKKNIGDVPRDEYLEAQRFLLCLKYEARFLAEAS